ncbi:TetR/AcrR family transcriptional regulator [Paenibacillus thermotolerans]|uniref:TetR/AcrR family transcriptional regulator n=1 Tax=Paenibacillus thermotolerans TaxID=3027807 RepID=UPI002367771F|nr:MULTISPECIES: TetR family transcriptional regulator [unclassified Paenibacillus]
MPKISEEQKEAVRQDILAAARNVFMRKGYEAASMKDIVVESGKSFGGVYMYYPSKEKLFYDLLRRQYTRMGEQLIQQEPDDSWTAVERFLESQLKLAAEAESGLAPCMYEFFIVGRRDKERRKVIDERHRAVYASIERLLLEGIERGLFRPAVPVESIVHSLISFLDGVFIESIITGHDRIGLDRQFELVKSLLKNLLIEHGGTVQ